MRSPNRSPLRVEALEDRSLPAAFGIPWADPGHLTLSFVPDGTPTPTGPSTLFATLNKVAPTATWEKEILRAFQTWAVNVNVNVGVVPDDGQPLGTLGAVQGDSRFGDIRIAAAPNSSPEVATASPFSWTGTTFAGDVVFGSGNPFTIGNRSGAYDIFSVAVHEAGHVLGLDHSTVAGSVMQETYAYRTGLGGDDVARVQALYGARSPDALDLAAGTGGNDTTGHASAVPKAPGGSGQLAAMGDLTTAADVDYYKLQVPALLTEATVRLKVSGISVLTPSLTVYNSSGRVVVSAATTDPLNNDLTVRFNGGLLGGTYYVKVDGATNDVFGVGGYEVAVDYGVLGGLLNPVVNLLTPVVDVVTGLLSGAVPLAPQTSTDARFDAAHRGEIQHSTDVNTFRIWSNKFASGTPVDLNVMVWGLDQSPLNPRVRVFDAAGNPVAFQVLADDTGLFSVQVLNAIAGQSYYVQVSARNPGAANSTGSYFLGADFNQMTPTTFDGVGGNTLAAGAADSGTLTVTDAGVFEFSLAALGGGLSMTLYDAAGNAVATLGATDGQPAVTTLSYLAAGTYTVRYTAAAGAPVQYGLFLLQLSDGIGPYSSNTSGSSGTSGGSSGGLSGGGSGPNYTYSGSSTSTTPTGYGYSF